MLSGSAILIAATLALSACGGSQRAISGGPRLLAATTPTSRIAAERKREATAEAHRMLDEFAPPPGARAIQVRPGHYRDAHVLHQSPGRMASEVVSLHRFWSVRMPLKTVIKFLRAHRLRGFRPTDAMWYTRKPHYLAMGSVWPASTNRLPSRFFTVTPVGLPDRTVLRVDSRVAWTYPRSPTEKVPPGAQEIVVRTPKASVKVTEPRKVARIVRWLDALPISPPGVHIPCFARWSVGGITVSFRSAHGALVARAKVPPGEAGICDPIGFWIGGHHQPPLIDRGVPLGQTFVGRLQRLLGRHLVQTHR